MDGFNLESVSGLNDVIENIVMMQKKNCVIDVTCDCGMIHRVPLDGFHICEVCGWTVLSPILSGELI